MTDPEEVLFPNEGDVTFTPNTETDNSAESPSEETKTAETPSPGGDSTQVEDATKPLHENPRWREREESWKNRFNTMESRHQEDMAKLREEFGAKPKEAVESTPIPKWFGGGKTDEATQAMWDEYRRDRDAELRSAQEAAIANVTRAKTLEDKAVAEATAYMQSEVAEIETDPSMNPSGARINVDKLVKFAVDNECIDSKGRWNYKVAWKAMNRQGAVIVPKATADDERKVLASASGTESRGEPRKSSVTSSRDFEKPGSRPW